MKFDSNLKSIFILNYIKKYKIKVLDNLSILKKEDNLLLAPNRSDQNIIGPLELILIKTLMSIIGIIRITIKINANKKSNIFLPNIMHNFIFYHITYDSILVYKLILL